MRIPTIIIDNREQTPWRFSARVQVVRGTLKTGDYSISGLEGAVAIERKTREDLVNTLTHGRDRFRAEMNRFRGFLFAAIFVESDLFPIEDGRYHSAASPKSVIASVASLMADFGVPVIFCGNRAGASALAEDVLCRLHSRHLGAK